MTFYKDQWSYEEIKQRNALNVMSAQLAALSEKLDKWERARAIQSQFITCELCGGAHTSDRCPMYAESIQYVGNYNMQQDYFYSNDYHSDWSDYPNFSESNCQWPSYSVEPTFYQGFPPQPQVLIQEKKPSLEDMLMQFTQSQASTYQILATSLRNMETQVGQLVDAFINNPSQGTLPCDTETNFMNDKKIEEDSEELELPNKSFEEKLVGDKHDEEVQEEKTQSNPPSLPKEYDEYCAGNVVESASNEVFIESYPIYPFEASLISTSRWDNIDFIGCSKLLEAQPHFISSYPQLEPLKFSANATSSSKPTITKPQSLEQKPLPTHLRDYKRALGWSIADIKWPRKFKVNGQRFKHLWGGKFGRQRSYSSLAYPK